MARHANYDWRLPDGPTVHYEAVQVAILMDIRDELQTLNRLLRCDNFIGIPNQLRRIATNTTKPRRKRKAAK